MAISKYKEGYRGIDVFDQSYRPQDYVKSPEQLRMEYQEALSKGALSQAEIEEGINAGALQLSDLTAAGDYWKADLDRQKAQLEKDKEQFAFDQERGVDSSGRPIAAKWKGIANQDGTLQDAYRMKDWQSVNPNTDALAKYRQEALRDAGQQSAWAKMATQQQGMQEAMDMDSATVGGQNALLAAQSEMAQSSGLSEGARERIASKSMRDQLLNQQSVRRQGSMDRMNIGMQDEQGRMGALQQLQGMENTQAEGLARNQQYQKEVEKYNLGNQFEELKGKRLYDANKYNEAMQAWAAGKSADAQANAARSGGGKK